MSDLQAVCVTLATINRDATVLASELRQSAQSLAHASHAAAHVNRSTRRPEGESAARALDVASRCLQRAAELLHHVSVAGLEYVALHDGGGQRTGGAGGARHVDGRGDLTPAAERYVRPGPQEHALLQQLVSVFGARHPSGWISAGNPHFASGDPMWTNNCGPCSRAFADTFHGKSASPALGDSQVPPGEYDEMWEAVGTRPSSRLTNVGSPPHEFSASAFHQVADSLRREGPGAVAIIGVDWDVEGLPRGHGGGHWLNAYVDVEGTVQWADEQIGQTGGWPPRYRTDIWRVEAVVRPSPDSEWKELPL
jgi:hypothetical protein